VSTLASLRLVFSKKMDSHITAPTLTSAAGEVGLDLRWQRDFTELTLTPAAR